MKTIESVAGGFVSALYENAYPAEFVGQEFQSKSLWQGSLLYSMVFNSNSKAFVQLTSSPESFKLKFFSYKSTHQQA